MSSRIIHLLSEENPVPPASAGDHSLPAGQDLLDLLPSRAAQETQIASRPWTTRLAPVLASMLLAIIGATVFTQPGQAMTDWIGDRLGLGHPGEEPTKAVQRFRSGTTMATSASGQPAHVLAAGLAPDNYRYEFITYWPKTPAGSLPRNWELGKPCFELDLVKREQQIARNGRRFRPRSSYGQLCGVSPTGSIYVTTGGNLARGEESLFFTGRVGAQAQAVEALVDGEPVDVQLKTVDEPLVRRFRLGEPFKFFLGFLDVRDGGILSVVARDSYGQVIARRQTQLTNIEVMQANQCRFARDALRRGIGKRTSALRYVRESCRGYGDISEKGGNPLKPSR